MVLAKVREKQCRFLEAADEWKQVIRIRTKEPTGYLGLACALIEGGRKQDAEDVLKVLRRESWHPRFGDVE